MSFTVFTDSCSNLPNALYQRLNISLVPCAYTLEDKTYTYDGDLEHFDAKAYYDKLRAGKLCKTTLINMQTFEDAFRSALEQDSDVLYVGMGESISGTFQAACIAAEELAEAFPSRRIRTVNSKGAGLGTGLLACRAADLCAEQKTVDEAADRLESEREHLCEYFAVEDLKHLSRTGRLSSTAATVGTMLHIKPLLYGSPAGKIEACGKYLGRKKAIDAMVKKYEHLAVQPELGRVAITHGDCEADAQELAERISAIAKPKELYICPHEPFTGSHVGPGMLALFFFGKQR